MSRPPRIEYGGAIYHVMNRGNHLEPIFRDDLDHRLFIQALGQTCKSSGWVVHSFVLMKNHYHLLIETLRATLVVGMQYLDSTYTRRYNVRHRTFGHLFQGRYKALIVDGDSPGYFITVSDYIHLNPVRARLILEPKDLLKDPWNSAGWLAGCHRKGYPPWLKWERVYGQLGLGDWRTRSRREYRQYLGRRLVEVRKEWGKHERKPWEPIQKGWCLGSDEFVNRMKDKLEELSQKPHESDSWDGPAVEEKELDLATRLLGEGVKGLGYSRLDQIQGNDRTLLALWVRSRCRARIPWLASQLGFKSRNGLSARLSQMEKRIQTESALKHRWNIFNDVKI